LASGRSPSGACSPAFQVSRGPRGVSSSAVQLLGGGTVYFCGYRSNRINFSVASFASLPRVRLLLSFSGYCAVVGVGVFSGDRRWRSSVCFPSGTGGEAWLCRGEADIDSVRRRMEEVGILLLRLSFPLLAVAAGVEVDWILVLRGRVWFLPRKLLQKKTNECMEY